MNVQIREIGPEDWLVLVSYEDMSQSQLEDVKRKVPEPLRNRVMVINGGAFDVKVMRP